MLLIVCHVVVERVKELGPGGRIEGKPAEIEMPNEPNYGVMSPQNSDLARLKTSNVSGHAARLAGRMLIFTEIWNIFSLS